MPWTRLKRLELSFFLQASVYASANGSWFDPAKRGGKRNSVLLDGFAGSKMILTLLTKIVALYVEPTAVDAQGLGLEFVSRSTLWGIEKYLDDSI